MKALQGNRGAGRNARILLALGLAVCTLIFVALSTSHIHSGGQDDAACRLCQAAHTGWAVATAAEALPAPLIQRPELPRLETCAGLEFFLHNSPSRAPPSA